MARPPAEDPLVPITLRLPRSVKAQLLAHAEKEGVTVSDAFRAHVTAEAVKVLAKPRRSSTDRKLRRYSRTDPDLLLQISRIGNNLNELARAVNTEGVATKLLEILAEITRTRSELERIATPNSDKSD